MHKPIRDCNVSLHLGCLSFYQKQIEMIKFVFLSVVAMVLLSSFQYLFKVLSLDLHWNLLQWPIFH